MIPKRIIQTGPKDLPLVLQAGLASARLLHPDFEHQYFGDAEIETFIEKYFPQYSAAYHSFRFNIQRFDFFRYLAVYQLGGFYLDLDVFFARELTPLLNRACVFAFEELAEPPYFYEHLKMDWQIGNFAFGAEPGHPFLAAIIRNCLRAKERPDWVTPMLKGIPRSFREEFYVLNTSGPGLVSRTLAENPQLWSAVSVLFPEDVCDPSTWHHFGTYGVHLMNGSWRPDAVSFRRRLARLWERWNLRRVVRRARALGATRSVVGPLVRPSVEDGAAHPRSLAQSAFREE